MDLLITGLPRSGTSYLCNILHRVENCVAINEPRALFQRLAGPQPTPIVALYHDLRADILAGRAVENKWQAGQVIEDTWVQEGFVSYHPVVTRPDFLLATKNTLGYLARLPALRQLLPQAQFVACVRHPLDTLASWKAGFAHLQQADVAHFAVGACGDPYLSEWQQAQLAVIAKTADLPRRRALLWRYLAEWLWQHRDFLLYLPYEQTVPDPVGSLRQLFAHSGCSLPLNFPESAPQPSQLRHKRHCLEAADYAAAELCADVAAQFGYYE